LAFGDVNSNAGDLTIRCIRLAFPIELSSLSRPAAHDA
jgi:hypothetical protein